MQYSKLTFIPKPNMKLHRGVAKEWLFSCSRDCMEFVYSPYNRVPFILLPWFHGVLTHVQDSRLIALSKLPLVYRINVIVGRHANSWPFASESPVPLKLNRKRPCNGAHEEPQITEEAGIFTITQNAETTQRIRHRKWICDLKRTFISHIWRWDTS